ncbi:MAG: Release factor glutamine methyltransferase [Chlamydiae bacterium]|nr:Release factor glutamine methyltransferase [Chlamydiota bacterium]
MITLQDVLKKSTHFLEKKDVSDSRRQAEEILSFSLRISRIQLYTQFDQPIQEAELEVIRKNLARRAKREPLQYIEGKVAFFNTEIKVTRNVLIPRQETEIMVDAIANALKQENLEGKILWDLCCGSGCIGISLKKMFPEMRVVLSDVSKDALKVASENAALNQVDVECYSGDLFEPNLGPVDFLVSNPPYISEDEFKKLEPEVSQHEPKLSLVSGPTGLEFYERIQADIRKNLKNDAKAWFEIGSDQKESLEQLFCSKDNFNTSFQKDYAGHDRFFLLELE